MRCSSCGGENPDDNKFCGDCGAPLTNCCRTCGSDNPIGKRFCGECGASLGVENGSTQLPGSYSSARKTTLSGEQIASTIAEGERKTVTAMFADLKGSTELIRELDPERARSIIDPALKIMVDAVHQYDGYVVQSTGDGIFALFGAPLAHEDHPQRALYAALRMQHVLSEWAEPFSNTEDHRPKRVLEARVGINSGEVVMRTFETGGRVEYTPIGYVTNLAARLQTFAPAGGIAVSEETRRLVEGYFELRSIGPTAIKGAAEPVNIYEVIGLGPLRTHFQLSSRRGLTKFVGREEELRQLRRAFESARRGRGQIAAIVAEAGTGKSRLVHEFKATIPAECKLLEAYSVSHGKASAWLPVLELLHGYFGFLDADDAAMRRQKIRTALAVLDASLADALPYLCTLLSIPEEPDPLVQMDPQIKIQRTLEALKRVILRESLNQPVVVIFEDLHWIDSETQALLDQMADCIANARVLMLVNYRPEYRHEWANKSYYSQLVLEPLDSVAASEMLTALLGDNLDLNQVKSLIIQRSEGNPFFIEEMLQALFDEGVLARNGVVEITRPFAQLGLPSSVQGILAARIDRQPREHKQLLQTLAVIGRESRLDLVRQIVSAPEPQLHQMLAQLQASEFIYEQPAFPDPKYVFKHALTQEVAYGSVLVERRRMLHEQVAYAIEALYEGHIEGHLSELAYHYRRTNNKSKAIDYMKRAAAHAAECSAVSEGETQLREAVSLLASWPATRERDVRELELQTALGALLVSRSFGAPEREQPLRRAYELSERIGDKPEIVRVLYQLGQFCVQQARFSEAREMAERGVMLAIQTKDFILEAGAQEFLGECCLWTGHPVEARACFERALGLCEEMSAPDLIRAYGFDLCTIPLLCLGMVELLLGWPERAMHRERRVLERALSTSHPYSQALCFVVTAMTRWLRNDAKDACKILIPACQICDEYGFHELSGLAKQINGWGHFWQGERVLGITEMGQAIQELNTVGAYIFSPCRFILLAEMQLESGEVRTAETLVQQAIETLRTTKEVWYEPEAYRMAAIVMLKKPDGDLIAAEGYLRRAIEIARDQLAKWWELRAAVSLARLLTKQGRRDEARSILAEIYGWFTEGFDTADLKEAKELLDELSD